MFTNVPWLRCKEVNWNERKERRGETKGSNDVLRYLFLPFFQMRTSVTRTSTIRTARVLDIRYKGQSKCCLFGCLARNNKLGIK